MKLKLDADGHVVVQDGKPVYVADDGKEFPIDGGHLYGRVRDLTTENAGHRKAKEDAEAKLKPFEGIEDPDAAKKAMETVANLDSGQLLTAGKVDEIKAAAKKAAEDQVAAANKASAEQIAKLTGEKDTLTGELYSEKIGGAFSRSKFIADKIAVPPDMVQATFGKAFKVEDGKTVAYDHTGNKIYSRARPGELADFDEALEALVEQYPSRDNILKGNVGPGGGAANPGGAQGGAKQMPRTEFEKLDPVTKATKMKEGFTLTEA